LLPLLPTLCLSKCQTVPPSLTNIVTFASILKYAHLSSIRLPHPLVYHLSILMGYFLKYIGSPLIMLSFMVEVSVLCTDGAPAHGPEDAPAGGYFLVGWGCFLLPPNRTVADVADRQTEGRGPFLSEMRPAGAIYGKTWRPPRTVCSPAPLPETPCTRIHLSSDVREA